jgi:hypothetical protein
VRPLRVRAAADLMARLAAGSASAPAAAAAAASPSTPSPLSAPVAAMPTRRLLWEVIDGLADPREMHAARDTPAGGARMPNKGGGLGAAAALELLSVLPDDAELGPAAGARRVGGGGGQEEDEDDGGVFGGWADF